MADSAFRSRGLEHLLSAAECLAQQDAAWYADQQALNDLVGLFSAVRSLRLEMRDPSSHATLREYCQGAFHLTLSCVLVAQPSRSSRWGTDSETCQCST